MSFKRLPAFFPYANFSFMRIELRKITSDDDELVYHITKAAMLKYVEETFGSWEKTFQRKVIKEKINADTYKIIQLDGKDAGLLVVENEDGFIQLDSIYLLPIFQNKGIGTQLLKELKSTAVKRNVSIKLRVLACNPARLWYQREGFVVSEKTPERWFMEWNFVAA